MALQADKDGFLVGGTPVALDKEGFRRAYDIMMGMQKDIAAIRKALVSGAATASAATPIRRGASVSAFTNRQAVAIAKEVGDRAGKAVSVSRARDSKGKFIAGASTSQQAAAVVTASTKLAAKIAQEQAAQAKRDGKGRFTSGGRGYDHAESASKPGFMRRMFGRLRERLGDAGAAAGELEDTAATVDPGAAAAKETREMLAPIAQAGAGLFKLFGGEKSEEEKAEEKVAKKVHVPWYKKMLKAIGRGGAAAGEGIGGMLSKIPGLGAIGSLLGGGMGLLGRGAGMLGKGGMIGAAALGGWEIGSMIYEKFAPEIATIVDKSVAFAQGAWDSVTKKWDDVVKGWNSLTEDIGKKWTTITDAIGEKFGIAKQAVVNVYQQAVTKTTDGIEAAANTASTVKNAAKDAYSGAVNTASQGIEYVADKAGKAKGWLGDKLSGGKNAISEILETGKGYNVVRMPDGSVVRQQGARNWRNNNPGNIEFGEFAKKHGALGSDGRFAIFPSYEAGRSAKSDLIFNGKNYKDKTLTEAIARYAPPSENNTAAYQKAVLAAVGGANKRMSEYSTEERSRIMDAMERVEGFKQGSVSLLSPGRSATSPATNDASSLVRTGSSVAVGAPIGIGKLQQLPSAATPSSVMQIPAAPPTLIAASTGKESRQSQQVLVGNTIGQNMADRAIAQLATGGMASNLGT